MHKAHKASLNIPSSSVLRTAGPLTGTYRNPAEQTGGWNSNIHREIWHKSFLQLSHPSEMSRWPKNPKRPTQILLRWAEHMLVSTNTQLQTIPSLINHLSVHQFLPSASLQLSSRHWQMFAGTSGIPAELQKLGRCFCTTTLHQYITTVWENENLLSVFKKQEYYDIFIARQLQKVLWSTLQPLSWPLSALQSFWHCEQAAHLEPAEWCQVYQTG